MFGRKKAEAQPAKPDVYDQNRQLLAMAKQAGDKKIEIILSLVAVADDAMKMREAHNRIIDLFDESLDELLEDACLYFPADLSAKLTDLRHLFDRIDHDVDEAASHTTTLAKQAATHVKA